MALEGGLDVKNDLLHRFSVTDHVDFLDQEEFFTIHISPLKGLGGGG